MSRPPGVVVSMVSVKGAQFDTAVLEVGGDREQVGE